MPLQLHTWSVPFRAASPKLSIIKVKKLALICAKFLSHFNGENLLSHVGGVPYFFYPSKPVSAIFFFCLDRIDLIFPVLFYFGSASCVDASLFPKLRDGWGIKDKQSREQCWALRQMCSFWFRLAKGHQERGF